MMEIGLRPTISLEADKASLNYIATHSEMGVEKQGVRQRATSEGGSKF